MSDKWNYDGSIDKYPIKAGEVWEKDGNIVAVNDIFDGLPSFMMDADLVFIDPPWNLGNVNSFVTKAGLDEYHDDFKPFYKQVFKCLSLISPPIAYVEVGKEYLAEFMQEMKKLYKYVTVYNSTYYYKKDCLCYVIRGSHKRAKPKLDGMDEEDIIEWICEHEEYSCIGDFVMGRGLVGHYAWKNGRRFVGCELNPKRLAVLMNRIGGEWNHVNGCTPEMLLDAVMKKYECKKTKGVEICCTLIGLKSATNYFEWIRGVRSPRPDKAEKIQKAYERITLS